MVKGDLQHVTLAVLAGGRGTRMGVAKDRLLVRGTPILRELCGRIAWPGPTLLIAPRDGPLPIGHECFDNTVRDSVADEGPLRGLLTALEHASTPMTVTIPLDMPRIGAEQLAHVAGRLQLSSSHAALMLSHEVGGCIRTEPFPCAMTPAIAPVIRRRLGAAQLSLQALAEETSVVVERVDWPGEVWMNLNHAHELPDGINLP